jgi:hypothetical protein
MESALVHDAETDPAKARTHVLIVGVGHYPRLKGGGPGSDAAAMLGQLSSPGPSARAIADWFIEEYHYPRALLGSVALLLSENPREPYPPPGGAARPVPVPTYPAVAAEVEAWCKRGGGNEDSRLIFVFCGHGFGYGPETSLLMSDFDFRAGNPWNEAIDLEKLRAGTEKYAAAEQLFFIDACRRPHGDLVAPGAPIGQTPVSAKQKPRETFTRRRRAPIFFSTGHGEPARAKTGELSIFTQAFLAAMRGMGASDDYGPWVVDSLAMLKAIDHVSTRLTEEEFSDPQQPQGADAQVIPLHHLRTDPISPVYVRRDGGPCGPGELRYDVDGKVQVTHCTVEDDEVELRLPLGQYRLELIDGGNVVAHAPEARSAPMFKRASLQP